MYGNERNFLRQRHPAFTSANASLGWESGGDWQFRLWGRNLTNEKIHRQIDALSDDQLGAAFDAPRTYGVTVTREF